MKREIVIHFSLWFAFFVFLLLVKNHLTLDYWSFWLGGLIGIILPDIDHLVYVFFVKPADLTSQRVNFLLKKKEVGRTVSLIYETRDERKDLIFHTSIFQIVFLVLTFLLVTSSTSIFGKGLALSFSFHLLVDQLIDLNELKSLDNWGKLFPFNLDYKKSKIYLLASFFLVCIMGFLM